MKKTVIALGFVLTTIVVASNVYAFGGKQNFGEKMMGMGRMGKFPAQNMTISMQKISNGVIETMTTEDQEVLKGMYERLDQNLTKNFPKNTVNIVAKKITNGIETTKTSEDEALVAKWHEAIDRQELAKDIKREVENIENGVRITITSEKDEAIAQIKTQHKAQEANKPKNNNANMLHSVTEITNGIVIEITTTDAEMVQKIQNREQNEQGFKFGKKGYKGFMKNENCMKNNLHKKSKYQDGEKPTEKQCHGKRMNKNGFNNINQ